MKLFFSGFCLNDEKELFEQYRISNDFSVSGFSFGAQKALEYVVNSDKRVDVLQLFSPAYFNDKDTKYKRMQLMFFKKDSLAYSEKFLTNCGFTKEQKDQYFTLGSYEDLDQLLNYNWNKEKLENLISKGIKLEVYLGSDDKIIDSEATKEFFKEFAEVYYIKQKGHIL